MIQTDPNETPRLKERELRAFVAAHFNRRDAYLDCLKTHPSPAYLVDERALLEKAGSFKGAFSDAFSEAGFYYAVKSNNHPDVSRLLLESGFGLDVSSGLELEMALSLDAHDIVFSGPGKTDAELTLAAENNGRVTVLMDSFGELERLDRISQTMARELRTGIRLTTDPNGLWRKFGILPEKLGTFMETAETFRYVRLEGIQFHTSWNLTPRAQVEFIQHMGRVLGQIKQIHRRKIRFIDVGGGYWPPEGEWLQASATPEGMRLAALGKAVAAPTIHYIQAANPISVFARELADAFKNHIFPHVRCRVCFEPGRWICHDAMHLLLTVVDKKAKDLVVTDAGTNAVGWERFESDYFPVLNLTRPALREVPCHILGSLCTPHDVWGYAYWGEDIETGDVLLIPSQGAYTYSLRQNFIKPLPGIVRICR